MDPYSMETYWNIKFRILEQSILQVKLTLNRLKLKKKTNRDPMDTKSTRKPIKKLKN